jgi:hypothetical protein
MRGSMAFGLGSRSDTTTSAALVWSALASLGAIAFGAACSEDDTRQAPTSGGTAGRQDAGGGRSAAGSGGTGGLAGTAGSGGSAGSEGSTGSSGSAGSGGAPDGAAGSGGASGTSGAGGSDAGTGTPFTTVYGLTGDSVSRGVAIDGTGNIYWVGAFNGQMDFGGGVLTSAGDYDVFVVKLDASGKHVWSKRFGDAQEQYGTVVAVDSSGDPYIGGYLKGTIDFGGGEMHTASSYEAFLAKLDGQNGNRIYSLSSTGSLSQNLAIEVAVDAQKNLYAVGRSDSSINLGGGVLTRNGAWFAKFDPTGAHLFSDAYGVASSANATGLALDNNGNVLIIGDLWTTVNFGGQDLRAVGDHDTFLAKLSPTLTHVLSKRYGDNGLSRGGEVATDAQGNIFIAGGLQGSIDFGGGAVSSTTHGSYLAKLDPSSNPIWAKAIAPSTSAAEIVFYDIAVERSTGDVVMVGSLAGNIDFGGGLRSGTGGTNAFIAQYTSAGAHAFSNLYGDDANQYAVDVAVDASGSAIVAGSLRGTLDFGSGPITSQTNERAYIARVLLP